MKNIIIAFIFAFSQIAFACPVGSVGASQSELDKFKATLKLQKRSEQKGRTPAANRTGIPVLPDASNAEPWGGSNPAAWKAEAILANAMSKALNEGWRQENIADVLVSSPVKMIFTNERVYGDGQTNASLQFGEGWEEREPQLVATLLIFKNGARKVQFAWSAHVELPTDQMTVVSFFDKDGKSQRRDDRLNVVKTQTSKKAEWLVPREVKFGDLGGSKPVWVQPAGWDASFPIDFRLPITKSPELLKAAGSALTAGKSPLDPLKILETARHANELSVTTLLNSEFGSEWARAGNGGNATRNESIHGQVHIEIKNHVGKVEVKTAVGGGYTWLVDRGQNSTFKNLYTCFDARNVQNESLSGVPSGGGWHEIGDAAETIINDLEEGPVVVGFATGLPWPTPPDSKKFAWGLSDVSTIRYLFPGESVVTPAGDQTWKEDESFRATKDNSNRGNEKSGGGRNYHWFFFHSNTPVCTQEWVHHCRPIGDTQLGLGC